MEQGQKLREKDVSRMKKLVTLMQKPGTEEEGNAAKTRLEEICKKHQIRLSDYVKEAGVGFDFRTEEVKAADTGKKTEKNVSSQARTGTKGIAGMGSRRGHIISMVQTGNYTRSEIAEELKQYGYNDVKANQKAVSGTLADMKVNQGWVVGEVEGKIKVTIPQPVKKEEKPAEATTNTGSF
jgi:hypothetical protein